VRKPCPGKRIGLLDVVKELDQFVGSRANFLDFVGLLYSVEIVADVVDATTGRRLRVGFLEIPRTDSAEGMCAAMASTGTRDRWPSNRPLMGCRLPGPQLPAQTASFPVRCASAPAANAATSSFDLALPTERVGQAVQAIADDTVNTFDPGSGESFRELIGNAHDHGHSLL
jgi:hypothetical protein